MCQCVCALEFKVLRREIHMENKCGALGRFEEEKIGKKKINKYVEFWKLETSIYWVGGLGACNCFFRVYFIYIFKCGLWTNNEVHEYRNINIYFSFKFTNIWYKNNSNPKMMCQNRPIPKYLILIEKLERFRIRMDNLACELLPFTSR